MLTKTSNNIQGVAAANDGLGNAVVSALKAHQLQADPGDRPGRDRAGRAEHPRGRQCMTVYKAVPVEAAAAAKLAISLIKGGKPVGINGSVSNGKRKVPSVLLTPSVDHEGELQDPVHAGLPEEVRRLQRRVREVLQVGHIACMARAAVTAALALSC